LPRGDEYCGTPHFKDILVKATFARLSTCALAAAVAACGSSSNGFNPRTAKGPDTQCVVGDLAVGTMVTGDLSAATACAYPAEYDSTITGLTVSYNFGGAAGKGYLVSLQSNWGNQTTLIGGSSGAKTVLAYSDYGGDEQPTLVFVPPANTGYSVRAGAFDSTASDTGAYTLRAQTCKVPVKTITDSVSHADNLGPGDCVLPQGDYTGNDSSYVHIYQIQFDSASTRELMFIVGDSSLAFNFGGPGFDPYGYLPGSTSTNVSGITGGMGPLTSSSAGIYTLIVGTTEFAPTSQPYTIIVGSETPAASRVPTGTPFVTPLGRATVKAHKLRPK
jgi:hypothetical protein